jgi:rubrerythrin
LHGKWGRQTFSNISQSEERHFDAIKMLLDRYNLPDPAANNPIGVFQNQELQSLYSNLIKQGESSPQAALRIGATIEDLDIRDLEQAAAATDNEDLKFVYVNLLGAAENHIRTFVGQLEATGESYHAQYIGSAAMSEILAGPKKTGMGYGARGYRQRGRGLGNNGICRWIQP